MGRFNFERTWENLMGPVSEFSLEKRAFHGVGLVTIVVLCIFLPFNIYMGLKEISVAVGITTLLQFWFYYLSRVKKKFLVGSIFYAISSYVLLAFTFYFNSGINGPIVFLFLLTFFLLITFTPKRQHLIWVVMHSITAVSLLILQYYRPDLITYTYSTEADRYVDIISSYLVTLGFIYFLTVYLLNNYNKEKKLAEERAAAMEQQSLHLQALNEEKNKLFSIISHDLRSPLNTIQGYLELLSMDVLSEEEKGTIKKDLTSITSKTSNMLLNLLNWSKAQMEGTSLQVVPLNLCGAICEGLQLQKEIAEGKEITLSHSVDKSIKIMADANMLQLVVRNLVDNAIKFTPQGGMISVTTTTDNGNAILAVRDSGIGMSLEKQQEIFSFKASSTAGTLNEKGIGLGLLLCKEFTELQGGRIWFESAQGKGSAFFLSFPLVNNANKTVVAGVATSY